MTRFTVGQKVYTVRQRTTDWRTGAREDVWEEHTIAKVGRKYATTVKRTRILLDTGRNDHGQRFWTSKEERDVDVLLHKEWLSLKGEFDNLWNRPEHVTAEVIGQIRGLLRGGGS